MPRTEEKYCADYDNVRFEKSGGTHPVSVERLKEIGFCTLIEAKNISRRSEMDEVQNIGGKPPNVDQFSQQKSCIATTDYLYTSFNNAK